MNSNMMKWFGKACAFVAVALFAGNAWAAYKDFASDAMSAASGFSGGSVSGGTLTVTDASKLAYVPGGSNDSLNRKDRGWYAGATIRWPEGGSRDEDASMQTSRMTSSVSGTSDLSGTTLTRTTEHARMHTCMATTTWWGYITPEEAYAKKTGNFTTTLTMSGKNYGLTTYGVNPATFTIDFPVDGLVLKDDKGVQWYPVVATNGTTAKVYGDLNVALKDGGEVISVADAAITNAITLEAGVTFRKNGKAVTGLEKLTLLGGSYDFDPKAAGCTLGAGCIAQYNESTLLYDVIPCPHEWEYSINEAGDTFTATCKKGCGYTPQILTISLSATSKTYDGTEISASLTYNKSEAEFKEQTGATVGAIVYSGDRKSAGDQKASVTITVVGGTEYTISKTLTIAPAQMSTATVTLQSATMNFADKELTNAVSSVTAPGISTDDWEVVDPTALYQAGSGYSNCTYTVTLQGKKNFTGTTTATWTILAPTGTFAADAMGRGDFETGGKLYNDNYGEVVGRELVVTASPNIIFYGGHWFVGATVDVPNDVKLVRPSESQITPDENLRVTVSTTGKTYTGTQIYGGQVTDTIFQVKSGDHDSQGWAGLGTFQYFKKIRWFTEISPAMVEQAKLAGKDELTFTLTVGGITGRWEGLKYTDFVIKAPLDGFVFKVGRNEFNTADIGNVAFSTNTPSIQLVADSVVTNACAIDYTDKKRIFTEVANYSVFETKASDTCWVYSCEHSVVTITVPNVANQASKVVKVGETEIVATDAAKTQYKVRYGDTVTIDYTANAGYIPPTATKTMTNVKNGDTLTDLPDFKWPTFTFDPAAPTNTTAAVSTNGVELTAPYVVNSNDTVHVVYKADADCYFADGTTEKTIDDMTITTNTVVSAEKRPAQAWPAHKCDGVTFTKRITDTATLQALFENGGNGYFATNVMLTGDAVADKAFTGTINFCLNGYVLDANGHFVNLLGGEATVYDCGTTTNYFTFAANGLWELTDDIENADTNLLGGVVTGGGRNPADPEYPVLYVGGNAISLTIKGGNFVGNQSTKWGGVVDNYGSKLVIDGGTFAGNRCATYGGVVYACKGEVEINGGAFVSNRCDYSGGVIYAYDNDVTVMDGTFIGNYAEYGGVIELDCYDGERAVSLAVEDGLFMGNSAKSGGVVYGYAGKNGLAVEVDIGGGCFEDNQADYGGVYYAYGDNCILTAGGDAMFVGNKVTVDGNCGGAFYNGGRMTLQDNVVISNTLAGWGTIYNSGTLTVTGDVQVVDNVANYGGAIYTYHSSKKPGGVCNVYGGLFKGNAAFNGGACWSSLGACVTVGGDAMFVGNTGMGEDNCGGAFYNNGTMTLQDNVVISNTLAGWGTIYNYGTLTVTGDVQVVDNVVTANGGAIYNRRYDSSYPGVCRVYGGTFAGNGDYTAFVNSSCGTFELGGSPAIEDNGNESGEYDLVASENSPFALSETVPYAADRVVTVGSFAADGTNNFIAVLTNAKATDADRFVSSDPAYVTWFDASDDTLKLVLPVAQIVTNGVTNLFARLDQAFAAAQSNDTVTLLKACKSDGEAIDLPLTLDQNGNAVTNLTLGAGAVLTLKGETESPNKLRGENPEMFGTIADGAKVVTSKTYVYFETLDAFYDADHEAVADIYGKDGVTYRESYATFSNALEVVATNGTVYALKKEISTPGFTINRNMTIDLEKTNPTGTNTLTITSAYAKKTGIYVDKKTTGVVFKGGKIAAAGSGICTLVETASGKLSLADTILDGANLDTTKTPYTLSVLGGKLFPTNTIISAKNGYAFAVNGYGSTTNILVGFDAAGASCRIDGDILINVQNDATVKIRFGTLALTADQTIVVNSFNVNTIVTAEAKPLNAFNKDFYKWVQYPGQWQLVFGTASIGKTYYSALEMAFWEAEDGDTIVLLRPTEIVSVASECNVTLDLNGFEVVGPETEDAIVAQKDLTIVGTNYGSVIRGTLAASGKLKLLGGKYVAPAGAPAVRSLGTGAYDIEIDGATAYAANAMVLAITNANAGGTCKVLNSRMTGLGGIAVTAGNLTVSNTAVQASGAANAVLVDEQGALEVKLLEGTQLLSVEGFDQLYWKTNATAKAVITKKDGIDCLAQEGCGWTTNGVEEGFLKLVPSTMTYDVMPLMFAKNLFNLAPAMKLNPAGQLTLDSDASVEVAGETVEVKPDDITIDVGDTADVITVKSIPDLTYELLAKESLLGEWEVVETKVATSAETAFTAEKDGAVAKFYTVRVRY